MNILITNDDGIRSRGLLVLADVAREFGRVTIAAPRTGQSGKSHAITVCRPLMHSPADYPLEDVEAHWVEGTPVDCVKLAVHHLVAGKHPDLLLSGINHGNNASSSVHYSGTIGAAREGAMLGIRSVAFSYDSYDPTSPIEECAHIVRAVLNNLALKQWDTSSYLNVNIPAGQVRGIRPCKVAAGHWIEKPFPVTDPFGQKFSWLTGEYVCDDTCGESDEPLLRQGYATISPCKLDVTDYEMLELLRDI